MATDDVTSAYAAKATGLADVLGTAVAPGDPDRAIIEPWAATVSGAILDVGSGTGRWSGHLAALGHSVEGLEPVGQFIDAARRAHPNVPFRHGSIAELVGSGERWAGIIAWYSLIHFGPDDLPATLSALRQALEDDGSLLVSFFSGHHLETIHHPATTAYRWPMRDMIQEVERAGFEVVDQHWHPSSLHAHITARAAAPFAAPEPSQP